MANLLAVTRTEQEFKRCSMGLEAWRQTAPEISSFRTVATLRFEK
jgi:hypothetical protein